MKIALLQMDICLGKFANNQIKVETMIGQAMDDFPDVIVLPEMWNIGFFPQNIKKYADQDGKMAQSLLSQLAKRFKVNIVGGSVATIKENLLYNTNYVVNRDGMIISEYQKVHLFSPSYEDKVFQAGTKFSTFFLDGVKAAVVICYDIRFGELIRLLTLDGISILFVVAAWPHPRLEHWQILLKARAIENQIFVVAVNGVGKADKMKFCGGSTIIDPWGNILAATQESEIVVKGTIDLAVIKDIRNRMNVFNDRRTDLYELSLKKIGNENIDF